VAGQGKQDASPNPQPTKQEHQALYSANGEQSQPKAGNQASKTDEDSPVGNAAIEGTKVWWRDSNWWLVIIAALTGGFIGWQSWETRKAAKAALSQMKLMKDNERARISLVGLPNPPDFEGLSYEAAGKKMRFMEGWIKVCNSGPTHAYNASGRAFWIVESPDKIASVYGRCLMPVPSVIRADTLEKPIDVEASQGMLEQDIAKVRDLTRNDAEALFLLGEISYEDVFGEPRVTPFRFRWEVNGFMEEGQWQDTSEWIDESPPTI
jgi:hypothetical protein